MKQFEYVLVLANKGCYSRAAEELNISQPSLSQYIKRLEKDLNVVLFDRTNGDVRLTDAGHVYIEAGKKILDTERQMQNRFADLSSYNTGSIVVGIAPTRCQYLMPEIVKRFNKFYPGMNLVVEERFLEDLVEDAAHGAFDLCVATLPVDTNKFSYDLMMREEVILAVPKNLELYEKLKKTATHMKGRMYPAVDIKLLEGAPYVYLSEKQPTQVHLNDLACKLGFSVSKVVKCMSIVTQFSMIKAGVGTALIPSSLAKYSKAETVEYFSLIQEIPGREMAVIYRKGQYLSKAILTLKEIMISV